MVTQIWVNVGSGNGLLPDGTNPLPEPMLTDHQWSPVTFILGQFSQEMPLPSITKICLKIWCLKFNSNFPGANELTGLIAWCQMVPNCGNTNTWLSGDILQIMVTRPTWAHTMKSRQSGKHFGEDVLKFISLYENCYILISRWSI